MSIEQDLDKMAQDRIKDLEVEIKQLQKRLRLIQEASQDEALSDGAMRHVAAMFSDEKWPYPVTGKLRAWAEEVAKNYSKE
ncbi:MAG: hypothetical protein WC441_05255 [Patescibacteria group bacterium]